MEGVLEQDLKLARRRVAKARAAIDSIWALSVDLPSIAGDRDECEEYERLYRDCERAFDTVEALREQLEDLATKAAIDRLRAARASGRHMALEQVLEEVASDV